MGEFSTGLDHWARLSGRHSAACHVPPTLIARLSVMLSAAPVVPGVGSWVAHWTAAGGVVIPRAGRGHLW